MIGFSRNRDDTEVEIAMQYNEGYLENILSYANNIHTVEGGTHVSGFKTALTRVINTYARKANLLKEKDPNLSGDDVREGLTAVISVKLTAPQFEGQTKTKLGNSEIEGMVNSIVGEALAEYLEEHPPIARKHHRQERSPPPAPATPPATRPTWSSARACWRTRDLPGTLWDCQERDPSKCELFLVEGKSAGGQRQAGPRQQVPGDPAAARRGAERRAGPPGQDAGERGDRHPHLRPGHRHRQQQRERQWQRQRARRG